MRPGVDLPPRCHSPREVSGWIVSTTGISRTGNATSLVAMQRKPARRGVAAPKALAYTDSTATAPSAISPVEGSTASQAMGEGAWHAVADGVTVKARR